MAPSRLFTCSFVSPPTSVCEDPAWPDTEDTARECGLGSLLLTSRTLRGPQPDT